MRLLTGSRRFAAAAAGLALAAVGATSATAAADTPPAPAGTAGTATTTTAAKPASKSVTLITGDVVTVTQNGGRVSDIKVKRPKGATGGYSVQTAHDDTFVLPDEAFPYIAAGVLDKRLFDVTDLIADGFAGADGLPLIVKYTDAAVRARSATTPQGTRMVRELPSIQGAAVTAKTGAGLWHALSSGTDARTPRTAVAAGQKPAFGAGIAKVWLDGRVKASMAESNAQIGSPAAWAAGVDGSGVTVAVLDTGYDDTHPAFDGKIADTKSFVPGETPQDRNGHGTHTASTIAGTGAGSTDDQEKGVAPGARLALGKVLGDDGNGDESWIIAGMEWAARDVKAPVVSMSLGSREPSDGTDPMAEAVDTLSDETGSLFVIAAGNSGAPGTIGSPGAAAAALTVGAVDNTDTLAGFSSQGPLSGTGALKPDISAPGVDILAARSSYLTSGTGLYQTLSGTSMATPHVAGVAAMLKQQHPTWTGGQLKNALMSSSKQLPNTSPYAYGAGRVDAAAATTTKITATGSVDFGFHAWPSTDDKPATREITYTNPGDQDAVLSLTSDFGSYNPAVTLSADTVTVPAHGTASVAATADPNKIDTGAAGASVTGQIRATDATGTVLGHTAGAFVKEAERYALTMTVLGRDGRPAPGAFVVVQRFDSEFPDGFTADEKGQVRLRVPPGTLLASATLDVPGVRSDSLGTALVLAPEVTVAKDTELVLDARKTVRADAVTERRSESLMRYLEYNRKGGVADFTDKYVVPVRYDSMWVTPTEPVTIGEFGFVSRIRAAEPLLTVNVAGRTFDDAAVQIGSPVKDGRFVQSKPVVFAGDGGAAGYAGVDARGAVAVVRASTAVTRAEQAVAAHEAGALLLLVVNPEPGRLFADYGVEGADAPLEVATLHRDEGEELIKKVRNSPPRTVRLTATGKKYASYVYDLAAPFLGAVPGDLVQRPTAANTSERKVVIYGTDEVTSEGRGVLVPWRTFDLFFQWYTAPGSVRTDYVSANPRLTWFQDVHRWDAAGDEVSEQRGHSAVHQARTSGTDTFYQPVLRPAIQDRTNNTPQRDGTFFGANIAPWGDAAGHSGFVPFGTDKTTTTLWRGDTKIASIAGQQLNWFNAAPETAEYRLVQDATRDPLRYPLTSEVHSEWTFTMGATTGKVLLPLITPTVQVDTDLAGRARWGTQALILTGRHQAGSTGGGTIGTASLEASYDGGKTWTKASAGEIAGGWKMVVQNPVSAKGGQVTLRVTLADDHGNKVSQTIHQAYGLT